MGDELKYLIGVLIGVVLAFVTRIGWRKVEDIKRKIP